MVTEKFTVDGSQVVEKIIEGKGHLGATAELSQVLQTLHFRGS